MAELRYALLADGTSDRALMYVLTWLLGQHVPEAHTITPEFADIGRLPRPLPNLHDRIREAARYYQCDILFIHRDAERQLADQRRQEIAEALGMAKKDISVPTTICVVPVRMTEAWLLFDEIAIRHSAGNPNGKAALGLPKKRQWEELADPKALLHDLLRTARAEFKRRANDFSPAAAIQRIPELIDDFSPLRGLAAFDALERDVAQNIHNGGWETPDR